NDTHGHEIGDTVLRHLAQHLRSRLRGSDVVARLGGEEFIALLPDTSLAQAQHVADDLVRWMRSQAHDQVGNITISAGLSALRPDDADAGAMLRRSDEALYEAKAAGRNRALAQP